MTRLDLDGVACLSGDPGGLLACRFGVRRVNECNLLLQATGALFITKLNFFVEAAILVFMR